MPPVAICEECGNVYTAKETKSGDWYLLGGKKACHCGSTEFQLVDDGEIETR